MKGECDAFIVGSNNSVVLGNRGIIIPDRIMRILRRKISHATKKAPFGKDKKGRSIGRGYRRFELEKSDVIYLSSLAQKQQKTKLVDECGNNTKQKRL